MGDRQHPTKARQWAALLASQENVFHRAQALRFGITDAMIRAQLAAQRWQRLFRGTYAAHNGKLDFRARAWAAALACGDSAVVSHRAAGYLIGLLDRAPATIDISVSTRHAPRGAAGIVVHRRRHSIAAIGSPPRTVVEETVLDLISQAARPDDVVALLTAACQRRLTTAPRLAAAAAQRQQLAWRTLVNDVLSDGDGVHSALEWRYRRDVERAHSLPRGERQRSRRYGKSNLYRDVLYEEYGLIVELDGAAAHPGEQKHRDMRRDNRAAVEGLSSLRYGWHDVAGEPCVAALQVAAVLAAGGWRGAPHACGPTCAAPEQSASP